MIRLKKAFAGERAAVVFGGPSLVERGFDFTMLADKGYVTFLEAKALTPHFLASGAEPDFYLLPFPEKAKDNALQHFVLLAFLADVNIAPLLRPRWRAVADDLKRHFYRYYEPWRPQRGLHKRYRLRPGVYLPDSPFELLASLPDVRLITHQARFSEQFPSFVPGGRAHLFDTLPPDGSFTLERYFEVSDDDGVLRLNQFSGQLNSAAIAVYPLLHYMGFCEVYCLGMDMSMLGSMEYAAPFTFRSMLAFRWFFHRVKRGFNADFRQNRPYYYRPASEFHDLARLAANSNVRIVRVHSPSKFSAHVPDVDTISVEDFVGR